MRVRFASGIFLCALFFWGVLGAQVLDEEEGGRKQSSIPKAVDFSKVFEKETMTREEFEVWKREREARLRERLSQVEALECAVDPDTYIVGPGDIFSFNIWGALEEQVPLIVSPEGKLLVPSVGEIDVDRRPLSEVQALVLEKASSYYEKSRVTLTLEALRFFRVHVVGEVEYPGTYVAQAVDRVSSMIAEAGGVTEWAWKRGIELRHPDGRIDFFDLAAFEQEGNLEQDLFVNGGSVVYVPPIGLGKSLVKVEGDLESAGVYQIFRDETLLAFLQRIRVLERNTDLSKIAVIRREDASEGQGTDCILPFADADSLGVDCPLQDGDRVVLPSKYVYVKGSVQHPGAYPYVLNLTAKDYAGMAGGDYRSGGIKGVKVYHARTKKTEKGPNILVEPGDVVHLNPGWNERFRNYIQFIPVITSLILAAEAAGLLGN